PAGKASRYERLELGADRLRKYWRRSVGGDADDQRRAVDDRSEGEIAKSRLVDHIDRHTGAARGGGEGLCLAVVRARSDCDRRTVEIASQPAARMDDDGPARRVGGQPGHLVREVLGIDIDARARRRKQLRLPGRRCRSAGDDGALAVEGEEDRKPRERRDASEHCVRRPSGRAHDGLLERIPFERINALRSSPRKRGPGAKLTSGKTGRGRTEG